MTDFEVAETGTRAALSEKDIQIEQLKSQLREMVGAVFAHRDNDEFLNVGTWNNCVATAERIDKEMNNG